jgi:hypothetical protein
MQVAITPFIPRACSRRRHHRRPALRAAPVEVWTSASHQPLWLTFMGIKSQETGIAG